MTACRFVNAGTIPAAIVLFLGWQCIFSPPARAQHSHEMTAAGSMASHPLGLSHGRFGSGTSWLPDAMALHHLMTRAGAWTLMAHGGVFAGGADMNGPRGDEKFFAPNMLMLMAERNAGESTFLRFSGMFSADAVTVGGAGYPILYQTGETWHDQPLADHQHPHNVFSELSASVTQRAGPAALSLYVAPVGEPALGPPAYPHRPVGGNDPLAPIGHHWQDATHISYGVVTAGIDTRRWRLEGSTFNGREPGENRAEIRAPEFDSFSGRVSVNPASELSLQTSYGYIHSPEAEHPEHDVWRTTASAVWVHPLSGGGRSVDATVVWGRNRSDHEDFDSWLFEGQLDRERGLGFFTRLEYVEKNAEELVLPATFDPERTFPLRQATLGAMYGLPIGGALSWGLGAQVVQSFTTRDLESAYGQNPGGWSVFLRVRPRVMAHAMMDMSM